MARKRKPSDVLEQNSPQAHIISPELLASGLGPAIEQAIESQGTEENWRNTITVPRPVDWKERPELVGRTVLPHTCNAQEHGDNPGCICELIGRTVEISGIYDSPFVSTPSYHIKGSKKLIQEREFSAYTKGKEPGIVEGFILEGPEGKFLTAGFVWMPAPNPLSGYLHNWQVVRDLLGADFPGGRPLKAYPAQSRYNGEDKRITGDPVPFSDLKI